MLSLSSPRRIIHSTSLRAVGSLIVFCSSAAWLDWPLRTAEIASLTAAMSAGETVSIEANANRGPATTAWIVPVLPTFAAGFGSGLAASFFVFLAGAFGGFF